MAVVCLMMIMVAANFRSMPYLLQSGKNPCVGYTIIEFDKGVDCYGDTIQLVRKNGFAQRAPNSNL